MTNLGVPLVYACACAFVLTPICVTMLSLSLLDLDRTWQPVYVPAITKTFAVFDNNQTVITDPWASYSPAPELSAETVRALPAIVGIPYLAVLIISVVCVPPQPPRPVPLKFKCPDAGCVILWCVAFITATLPLLVDILTLCWDKTVATLDLSTLHPNATVRPEFQVELLSMFINIPQACQHAQADAIAAVVLGLDVFWTIIISTSIWVAVLNQ